LARAPSEPQPCPDQKKKSGKRVAREALAARARALWPSFSACRVPPSRRRSRCAPLRATGRARGDGGSFKQLVVENRGAAPSRSHRLRESGEIILPQSACEFISADVCAARRASSAGQIGSCRRRAGVSTTHGHVLVRGEGAVPVAAGFHARAGRVGFERASCRSRGCATAGCARAFLLRVANRGGAGAALWSERPGSARAPGLAGVALRHVPPRFASTEELQSSSVCPSCAASASNTSSASTA
jgi:hypothetical protein